MFICVSMVVDDEGTGTHRCFLGGDLRLNVHAGLAALHTLLVHEHNRVASVLAELNPQWGDDTIFEEARAVVSAELQHLTYHEYLPTLLGARVIYDHGYYSHLACSDVHNVWYCT